MLRALVVAAGFLIASWAVAHRPIFPKVTPTSPETAAVVKRPKVSQVIYHEIAEGSEQVWLTFEGEAGQEIFLQVGVPVIDRLEDYRPTMALVGPGLPEADVHFELPPDCGIHTFGTAEVEEPRYFEEKFTGTDSWILKDATPALPESGTYYVVGYAPEDEHGKLWLSIGKKEDFGISDMGRMRNWTRKVRRFHEIDGTWPRLQKIAVGGLAGIFATLVYFLTKAAPR